MPHFPFYEFAGSPYEMGRQHGSQLREAVRRLVVDTLSAAERAGLSAGAALQWARDQRPRLEKLGPHWIDELHGLADGAGISFSEALALQVRPGIGKMVGGCTSIGASGCATANGEPLGAQNRDLFYGFRDRLVVTRHRPNCGLPLLMHTVPGELGGTGINGAGLALFANSIWAKSPRTWMGVPVFRRAVLETADAEAAARLVGAMEGPAVGSFLVMDAAGRMRNFEILPEGAAIHAQDDGVYVHTNHCLHTTQQPYEQQPLGAPGSPGRCVTMQQRLDESHGKIDVSRMKWLLSRHEPEGEAICRHGTLPGEYESAAASIAEPRHARLHLSYGPPCEGNFATYTV